MTEKVSAPDTHAVRFVDEESFAHLGLAPTGFNGSSLVSGEPHANIFTLRVQVQIDGDLGVER